LASTKGLRYGKRGRWAEKLFTLTLKHSGDVRRDLQALPRLWKELRAGLWSFFKHEYHLTAEHYRLLSFVRVIEVTASDEGHAHMHVYLLSPYIPHQLLRHLWGKVLAKEGYVSRTRAVADVLAEESDDYKRSRLAKVLVTRRGARGKALDTLFWPVVDIRVGYGDIDRELIKYLIKDGAYKAGVFVRVAPRQFTAFYEGLEGVRSIAKSRGFRALDEGTKEAAPRECTKCHSPDVRRRRVEKQNPTQTDEAKS
ncbi:MAG: Replication protein, partial [Myxococcaceae bacterium]|nr:Replication protein [Myxococcaceae bacterium]